MEQNKELAAFSEQQSMVSVIERMCKDPEINVDKLERLLAMQERAQAQMAVQEFNAAMMRVQKAAKGIKRNKHNSQTHSDYADLEAVNKQLVPMYTSEGFALSFGTADCPIEGHYRVVCEVSHIAGHSKHYQADLPRDTEGLKGNANKTTMHGFGSTMSYGRRYITLLIFNLTLTNEDNDGNGGHGDVEDFLTTNQITEIKNRIREYGLTEAKFLKWAQVDNVDEILGRNYDACLQAIEVSRQQKEAKEGKK